jgi:hypothetical protein
MVSMLDDDNIAQRGRQEEQAHALLLRGGGPRDQASLIRAREASSRGIGLAAAASGNAVTAEADREEESAEAAREEEGGRDTNLLYYFGTILNRQSATEESGSPR